jgi:hypothetical protein
VCFMRICDYKFAMYGFLAEHNRSTPIGALQLYVVVCHTRVARLDITTNGIP